MASDWLAALLAANQRLHLKIVVSYPCFYTKIALVVLTLMTYGTNNVIITEKWLHSITLPVLFGRYEYPGRKAIWTMMTSSNGNIFRVTGPLSGNPPVSPPLTNASDVELWCFFICAWTNGSANNRDTSDLRRRRAKNDVTVMRYWHGVESMK